MRYYFAFFAAVAALVSGCASKSITVTRSQELSGLIGRRVTIVGTAMHSCPGAMVFGGDNFCVFVEGIKYWPTNHDRQLIQVTGSLTRQHSPDLYFIRDARWTLAGKAGSTDAAETREIQQLLQDAGTTNLPVVYHNKQYDFTFFLPAGWKGYSVLTGQWDGGEAWHGPMIVLRHPHWNADDPYQDIPIMVFTRSQWEADKKGVFATGAGGVEFEIGHNRKYVFGIHSRFNWGESEGWQEASRIVEQNQAANAPHLIAE
jgi:hypothetical protein